MALTKRLQSEIPPVPPHGLRKRQKQRGKVSPSPGVFFFQEKNEIIYSPMQFPLNGLTKMLQSEIKVPLHIPIPTHH